MVSWPSYKSREQLVPDIYKSLHNPNGWAFRCEAPLGENSGACLGDTPLTHNDKSSPVNNAPCCVGRSNRRLGLRLIYTRLNAVSLIGITHTYTFRHKQAHSVRVCVWGVGWIKERIPQLRCLFFQSIVFFLVVFSFRLGVRCQN